MKFVKPLIERFYGGVVLGKIPANNFGKKPARVFRRIRAGECWVGVEMVGYCFINRSYIMCLKTTAH